MKKITKQWFNRRLESVFDIVMVLLKVFFFLKIHQNYFIFNITYQNLNFFLKSSI
jgi:hypothetical protein